MVGPLYGVAALGSFGERVWSFALPMLVAQSAPLLLWPVAVVSVAHVPFLLFAASPVGALIDVSNRLSLMRIALLIQNLSVSLSALCVAALLLNVAPLAPLLILLSLLSPLYHVAAQAGRVCLHKVWVVALCQRDEALLAHTNAVLKRIDLLCEIVAPLFVGGLLWIDEARGLVTTPFVLAALNLVFLVPEFLLLSALHRRLPEQLPSESAPRKLSLRDTFSSWPVYFRQPVLFASLAYCSLFVTVLMPAALLNSFLVLARIPFLAIAGFRGACAATGIAATLLAAPVSKRLGLNRAGLVFSAVQWLSLVPAVLALALPPPLVGADAFAFNSSAWNSSSSVLPPPPPVDGAWRIYVFLALVVVSRMGLWGFDVVEVSIMQTRVDPACSGAVNAVEDALTQLVSAIPLLAGVAAFEAHNFLFLVLGSFCFIVLAFVLFLAYVVRSPADTAVAVAVVSDSDDL